MIFRMHNKVMDYPWGTYDFIPHLLGKQPSGKPQAELWMGVHQKAESEIEYQGKQIKLSQFMKDHGYDPLNFLFKVLSAREPLSIQVHPNRGQATLGFDAENNANIPINSPHRNYRDAEHKPEIACALTGLWALAGFRSSREIADNLHRLCPESASDLIEELDQKGDIKEFYKSLMTSSYRPSIIHEAAHTASSHEDDISIWVTKLHNRHPADISQLAPAFLNLLYLEPGEAIYFPAGIMHSYLEGNIIELMSNSDNVIRSGLTGKHIDLDELLDVGVFRQQKPKIMQPLDYRTPLEFQLSTIPDRYKSKMHSDELIICIHGSGLIKSGEVYRIEKGNSFYIPRDTKYSFTGDALIYKACSR